EDVGPVDALAALQTRRQLLSVGRFVQPFPSRQLISESAQCLGVLGDISPLVRGRRGACETQTHAPVVTGGHQHERKEPAGQGLGRITEALVDAAAAGFAQKHATSIFAVIEYVAAGPNWPTLAEERSASQNLVPFPRLRLNAGLFLSRDGY